MLAAILSFSFIPLWIIGSGGAENPFLFNGMWRLGAVIGCLLLLFQGFRSLMFNWQVWKVIRSHTIRNWMLLFMTLEGLQFALFAWSTEYIEVPAASVLLELWPLGVIAILAWGHRKEVQTGRTPRYRRNMGSLLLLLSLAFAGVFFVVISQVKEVDLTLSTWIDTPISLDWSDIQGMVLAMLAAMAGSFGAFTLLWGRDLAGKLRKNLEESTGTTDYREESWELFGAILGFAIGSFLSVPISLAFGFYSGEGIVDEALTAGIIGGFIVLVPGVYLIRRALLATDNLGVTALGYGVPVITLGWFWLFSTVGIPIWLGIFWGTSVPVWLDTLSAIRVSSVPYLTIGTAAIVAANLLINFEADRLLGFKVLVISLWVCGTIVYLRDLAGWGWAAKSDGYFDVLFLSATVFALILSFRTQRLASRTQEEDNRALKVFRELEELEGRGVISPGAEIYEHILTIDEKQGQKLEDAYGAARRAISDALITAEGPDRKKLIAVSTDLDALAHSRQQGINFGEICALFIFAGLVVGTALLSRPAGVSELTGFLVEMFAMLFPAVILFLAFNVLDLQRDRVSRILVSNTQYSGYGVAFQDTESQNGTIRHSSRRFWEQRISVFVGVALIVAYAGLFLYKWGLLHKWGLLADFPGRFPGLLS